MLEGCLDSPQDSDPARILSLLRALTPREQAEFNADVSPTVRNIPTSSPNARSTPALTGMIMERTTMTSAIPGIIGAYAGGPGSATVVSRYNTRVTTLRSISRSTMTLPPASPFGMPF
jgi:hypothetical protein